MSSDGSINLVLITMDAALGAGLREAISGSARLNLTIVPHRIEPALHAFDPASARVIIADIDARDRAELLALQALMMKISGRVPVVVLTEAFDDAVARWLIQIRVADFLRKPVEPVELLKSCVKAVQSLAVPATDEAPASPDASQIVTFVPAMGGVGATSLAIETAMQMMRAGPGKQARTCIVDLDLQAGSCAEYLDLEARLDLSEIGPHPERIDYQLLDVMFSRHSSGLMLLAAPNRTAQLAEINTAVLMRLLDIVSSHFSNVVIDLPRHWRAWTDIVLMGSDRVYVVTDMTVPGLRAARQVASVVNERLPDEVNSKIIVNRFEQATLFGTGLRKADVEKALEGLLAGTVSNNYRLMREAIDRGVILDEVKPGSNVSTDLKKIIFADDAARSGGTRVA